MEILPILQRLGVALGLGLLVGLQRQRTEARLAGFLGSGKLLRKISGLFALGFLAGVLLLWLWPD